MVATMRAARLHEFGQPLQIEEVPVPRPGPSDALIKVHAVNIVPNLANVLGPWREWFPQYPLPTLPAIFGLDCSGVIEELGSDMEGFGFEVGDRVYVNPARSCGVCLQCRHGQMLDCPNFAFAGYFGASPNSIRVVNRYSGGLAEYTAAPGSSLVKLPDNVSFETGARFGYLGTMYRALKKGGAAPGKTLLVNGITGTLGIGAAFFGPAFGLTRILGTGRDRELLKRLDETAPGRFNLHSLLDGPVDEFVNEVTGGQGVDVYVDALGTGTDASPFLDALKVVPRPGRAINIGAVDGDVPINIRTLTARLESTAWFTTGEGQEMADLAGAGIVDLSPLIHHVVPLEQVNEAIGDFSHRIGGFSNYIVSPLAD